jgi:hypothetical protein
MLHNHNIYRLFLVGFLSLLLFNGVSIAQLSDFKRVDIPINTAEDDEFNVITFGQEGLILFSIKSNNFGRDQKLVFTKFDTELKTEWKNEFAAESGYSLIKYFDNNDYLFCLLKKDDKTDILILRIDVKRGDYIVSNCKMLTRMEIDAFTVVKSKAIIGGKYNDRPVVEMINLFDQSAKVLPEIHANNILLNTIEVNPESGELYVLLKNSKNCKFLLKVYNYDGKLISNTTLGEKKKLPVNGKILKTPEGEYFLAGNYADNCSDYSIGFYTHSLSGTEETKFYDFIELNNFLSYLPEKRQERVKKRIKNKKLKGKDFKLRHRLLLHDPVKTSGGNTLFAEVFYPEFKNYNNTFMPVTRNYRFVSSNYLNYNNFRYTHALICTFDNKGNLKWDNSVSLNEIQSRTLDQKVQLSEVDGKFIIAYPDEGVIKTTIIKQSETQEAENINLEEGNQDIRILDSQENELSSWYDHVFIAYGIQSVKSPNGLIPADVFYLSKLTYE